MDQFPDEKLWLWVSPVLLWMAADVIAAHGCRDQAHSVTWQGEPSEAQSWLSTCSVPCVFPLDALLWVSVGS